MTLNEWMTETRTKAPEIAAAIGRDASWVRHLRRGKMQPSLAVAQAIAVFTEGLVGLDDWPSSTPKAVANHPAEPG